MQRIHRLMTALAIAAGCSTGRQPTLEERPAVVEATAPPAAVRTAAPGHAPSTPAPAAQRPAPEPAPARALTSQQHASLRDALAAARKRQIARLRTYGKAGRFPTRPSPFNQPVMARPLFVDQSGVPCAVGYLMQQSGWTAEVAAIAASTPYVKIEQVTAGPIVDWVLRSGLTQDEATLIQPAYEAFMRKQAREFSLERKRLKAHFVKVENQLIANTEVSLDIAMVRVTPLYLANPSLEELGDRAKPTP